jgi:hypothetical protein
MKIRRWAWLLAIAPLLAGCGNFWQPPSSTGTGGGSTPSSLSSGFFYVLNSATRQIAGYSIVSGALTPVANPQYTLVAAPNAIAIAPSPGAFLYVATAAPGIYLYSVGSTGALTIANNSQPISQDPAAAMQVDTNSSWLVDAFVTSTGLQLDAIPITSSGVYSGAKVQSVGFTIPGATVNQLVISPDNSHVFVAMGTSGTLIVPFDSSAPFQAGISAKTLPPAVNLGSALSVAVDPGSTPRLFYIGETLASPAGGSGGLRAFLYSTLGNSTISQATGSPVASGGLSPKAILALSGGDYVYVGNGQGTASGNVAAFTVASTGTAAAPAYSITAGSTIAAGIQPYGLAEDSKGNYVLAVSNGGSPDLEAYSLSSGVLTSALTSATGSDPVQAVAVASAP